MNNTLFKKILASMHIAFSALRINKLRSALTMLGIIIGVAAVIAMVAVGSGAQVRIQQQIASIGSNIIVVVSGSITSSGLRMGTGNAQTLTEDDAKALLRDAPGVQAAAPTSRGGAQVVYGNNNWGTQIMGTTPDYLTIRDLGIEEGQAFTVADVESAAKVALLGKTVADNLFNGEDPVGKVIRIKKVPFTVVGTLVPKGQSPTGQDQDDVILLPISSAKKKVIGSSAANAARVGAITVQAREGMTAEAQEQMAICSTAAPSYSILTRRRLQHSRYDRSVQGARDVGQRDVGSAGGDCIGVIAGRRDRHHEHHAGIGNGAHKRDRTSAGRGGKDKGYSGAVSGGGRDAVGGGRCRRYRRRTDGQRAHLLFCGLVDGG